MIHGNTNTKFNEGWNFPFVKETNQKHLPSWMWRSTEPVSRKVRLKSCNASRSVNVYRRAKGRKSFNVTVIQSYRTVRFSSKPSFPLVSLWLVHPCNLMIARFSVWWTELRGSFKRYIPRSRICLVHKIVECCHFPCIMFLWITSLAYIKFSLLAWNAVNPCQIPFYDQILTVIRLVHFFAVKSSNVIYV